MGRGGSDSPLEVSVTIRRLRPGPNQEVAWKTLWQRLLAPSETDAEEYTSGQGSGDVDAQSSSGEH